MGQPLLAVPDHSPISVFPLDDQPHSVIASGLCPNALVGHSWTPPKTQEINGDLASLDAAIRPASLMQRRAPGPYGRSWKGSISSFRVMIYRFGRAGCRVCLGLVARLATWHH